MKRLLLLIAILICSGLPLQAFDKVVIWGHKLHSHTHSYIHNAFYRTFLHLGYETYWLDNEDDLSGLDLSHAFFISEGQVDEKIPLRQDGVYCIHNARSDKYTKLNPNQYFKFQVYTHAVHSIPDLIKVDNCIYYDLQGKCVYMPWATDLLPHEIEDNKRKINWKPRKKYCAWVGTIGGSTFGNINELTPFIQACKENHVAFIHHTNLSIEENNRFIRNAFLAPAIVGTWQSKVDYIPCRIFKNISYGKPGITNSRIVYELFEKKIVYNPDTRQLYFDAVNRINNMTLDELYEQMDFVKTKHTYINRIHTLLDFLELLNNSAP